MRLILSISTLLVVALALGQGAPGTPDTKAPASDIKGTNIELPSAGDRATWFGTSPDAPPSPDVAASTGQLIVVSNFNGPYFIIQDRTTGNLAFRKSADIQSGKTQFLASDFNRLAVVKVRVEYSGKPVAAASVDLLAGGATQTQVIGPSANGEVSFRAVMPGKLKVTVKTSSNGTTAAPVVQEFDVPLNRTEAEPTLKIAVSEPTDVAAAPTTEGGSPEGGAPVGEVKQREADPKTAEKTNPGNPVGNALVYLIFLGAVIAAGFYGLKYFRENQDALAPKLEQLGVQIPKPDDAPVTSASPVAAAPIAPQPVQKIVLDGAAPDPYVASPTMAAPVITGQPKLIAESSGDVLPLSDGELIVGREVGLGLSLANETTVSRKHASVLVNAGQVMVRDHGSTNGTFVNGVKVVGEAWIQPGDTVQFGAVRFRYEG